MVLPTWTPDGLHGHSALPMLWLWCGESGSPQDLAQPQWVGGSGNAKSFLRPPPRQFLNKMQARWRGSGQLLQEKKIRNPRLGWVYEGVPLHCDPYTNLSHTSILQKPFSIHSHLDLKNPLGEQKTHTRGSSVLSRNPRHFQMNSEPIVRKLCPRLVKNPPTKEGDKGSIPDPGRSHMPWSN